MPFFVFLYPIRIFTSPCEVINVFAKTPTRIIKRNLTIFIQKAYLFDIVDLYLYNPFDL